MNMLIASYIAQNFAATETVINVCASNVSGAMWAESDDLGIGHINRTGTASARSLAKQLALRHGFEVVALVVE